MNRSSFVRMMSQFAIDLSLTMKGLINIQNI